MSMTQEDVLFDGEDENVGPEKTENQEKQGSSVEGRYRISPLTLTVFKETTADGAVFRNYQLQRTYPKDTDSEEQEYGYTDSLRPRDLRKASRLLEMAADDVQGLRKEAPQGRKGDQ